MKDVMPTLKEFVKSLPENQKLTMQEAVGIPNTPKHLLDGLADLTKKYGKGRAEEAIDQLEGLTMCLGVSPKDIRYYLRAILDEDYSMAEDIERKFRNYHFDRS